MTTARTPLLVGLRNVALGLIGTINPLRALWVGELVAVVWLWNSWPSIVALMMAFFLQGTFLALATQAASGSMLIALGEFLVARSFAIYESIPLSAYTEKFAADHMSRMPLDSNPSPPGFFDRFLHQQHKKGNYKINAFVVRPSSLSDSVPIEISTYPTLAGTWMFLPYSPDEMTDIERFNFLHEYGHVSTSSLGRSQTAGIYVLVSMIGIAFFALRLEWTVITVAILSSIILCLLARTRLNRDNDVLHDVADEIKADYFALVRSDLAWFANFPAEKLAGFLCDMPKVDAVVLDHRKQAFIDVLETLRRGDTPQPVTHYGPSRFHHMKLQLLDALIGASFIGLFYWLQPATWTTVAVLGAALMVAVVVMIFFVAMLQTMASLFTMATVGSEISEDTVDMVLSSNRDLERLEAFMPFVAGRLPNLRSLLSLFTKLYDERTSARAEHAHHSLAIGTLPALFAPEDMDLATYPGSPDVYIFHSVSIDYAVDHLRYHDGPAEITVHYTNGSVSRLGVTLIWKIAAMVAIAKSIVIGRTEKHSNDDGRVLVEQVEVPVRPGSEDDDYLQRVSRARVEALRTQIMNCAPSSPDAVAQAQATVAEYTDEQVYALFANTGDDDLMRRPAFAQTLLSRLQC